MMFEDFIQDVAGVLYLGYEIELSSSLGCKSDLSSGDILPL